MSLKTPRQKLLEAIEQCQLTKIISLVKYGYTIHMQNALGQNFLVQILQQQQQEQDQLLSKKRFQIFQFLITNYNLNIHAIDHQGKNVFNWAANLNCTQEARYLLNTSPGDIDILLRDHTGSCSLHYAVEHGNDILVHGIVNYLLRYRIRFDIKDAYNNTPEDLARKLGYDKIGQFLAQACRSTIFLSREIPFPQQQQQQQQRPLTGISKSTASMTSSSFLDSSEYFNLIETRVNLAKSFDDWKTVTALRAFKKNPNEKKSHSVKIPDPTRQVNTNIPPMARFPLLTPTRRPSQSEQILQLLECQMTPSFRRPFTPNYQQPIQSNNGYSRSFNLQRKLSVASSRHLSSVLGQHKRDSDTSQISVSLLPDVQNRLSIPPVNKQYRSSVVTTN